MDFVPEANREFVLWERIPQGKPDDVFEPDYSLKITGGVSSGGVWAYGKGSLMKEIIKAELRMFYGISLKSPAIKLITMIIYRAHLLAQDPRFQTQIFWESDVKPGEYTEPD